MKLQFVYLSACLGLTKKASRQAGRRWEGKPGFSSNNVEHRQQIKRTVFETILLMHLTETVCIANAKNVRVYTCVLPGSASCSAVSGEGFLECQQHL